MKYLFDMLCFIILGVCIYLFNDSLNKLSDNRSPSEEDEDSTIINNVDEDDEEFPHTT